MSRIDNMYAGGTSLGIDEKGKPAVVKSEKKNIETDIKMDDNKIRHSSDRHELHHRHVKELLDAHKQHEVEHMKHDAKGNGSKEALHAKHEAEIKEIHAEQEKRLKKMHKNHEAEGK